MIISKISGGLGNQMFQYAIAKAIAIKNNNTFKLDISAYESYKLHNGYRLNIFSIEESLATKKEIIYLAGYTNRFLSKLKFPRKSTYYKEKERTVYDNNVFSFFDIYLDGYWQNENYFLPIRDSLVQDFLPKEEISVTANNYLNQIQSLVSVSIHVRRGDYLNNPQIGILDINYYKKAVNYLFKELKEVKFFIFSDDILWCKENFGFIDNKIFVENTETELDDLMLMRSCKHNILANSSFSWWAGWLNENSNKLVIAPKKWMVDNPNNYKWSSDTWTEI